MMPSQLFRKSDAPAKQWAASIDVAIALRYPVPECIFEKLTVQTRENDSKPGRTQFRALRPPHINTLRVGDEINRVAD